MPSVKSAKNKMYKKHVFRYFLPLSNMIVWLQTILILTRFLQFAFPKNCFRCKKTAKIIH